MRAFVRPVSALLALLFTGAAQAQEAAPAAAEETPAQPAQPAPAAAPAAAERPSSAAELEELQQRISALEQEREAERAAIAETDDQIFKIYGFLDVGLRKVFPPKDGLLKGLIERKTTFLLGNINLYLDAQPGPNWRGLVEARLTTYPHGVESVSATGRIERSDTRIYDINSSSGRNVVIWGGVVLERAQIEHTVIDLFNLRVGYFLTPYGIWNVDHGTPTLIALVLPSSQVEQALPARQLGVQAYGTAFAGETELGYAAYVSNGRAPFLEDPTDGKAVGGRVYSAFTLGETTQLKLGLSGYWGDSLEQSKTLTVGADGVEIDIETEYEYQEWGAGADVSLDAGAFRLRTEGLIHNVQHEPGKHEPVGMGAPGSLRPNRYEYYAYNILAYRIGAFEPYLYNEIRYSTPREGRSDITYLPGVGLNIFFAPYAQLKTGYVMVHFLRKDGTDVTDRNFSILDSRLVLSF
jgi:hypothetical protein